MATRKPAFGALLRVKIYGGEDKTAPRGGKLGLEDANDDRIVPRFPLILRVEG